MGEVDFTQPYFHVDGFFAERSRKSMFHVSCILGGVENIFLVEGKKEEVGRATTPYLTIFLSCMGAIPCLMLVYLIYMERKGKPLFVGARAKLLDEEGGQHGLEL